MNTTVIDRNAFPGRFSFWFAAIFGTAVAVSIAGLAFRCFVIRRRGLGNISYEFGLSAIEVPASLRSDHYSLSARNAFASPSESAFIFAGILNVLTPISRAISAAVRPARSCFTTPMICLSVSFLSCAISSPFLRPN